MLDSGLRLTKYRAPTQSQAEFCNGFLADCNGGGLAGAGFGAWLKQARLDKAAAVGDDVRPADAARAMGVTRSAYLQWEAGLTRPKDLPTYVRLCAFLGVELTDIPKEEAPPKPLKQRRRSKAQPHQTKKPERGSGS